MTDAPFVRRNIRVKMASGTALVAAFVFGKWAAHESVYSIGSEPYTRPAYGDYSVTLVGDGRCVSHGMSQLCLEDALAVAAALDRSGLHTVEQIAGQRYLVEAIVAEAVS